MTTSAVRILSVQIDPPFIDDPSRKRYLITLSCGCLWWEYHAERDAPQVGRTATCLAQHSAAVSAVVA